MRVAVLFSAQYKNDTHMQYMFPMFSQWVAQTVGFSQMVVLATKLSYLGFSMDLHVCNVNADIDDLMVLCFHARTQTYRTWQG